MKRQSNTSGYKSHQSEGRGHQSGERQRHSLLFRILASVSCLLLFASCAPKRVGLPLYEEVPLEKAMAELKSINSIEAVLAIEYEKKDSTMSGDASLRLSENNLNLRLYYLGFLAGEVNEENGIVKSKPKLDKNKSTILVDGLKNSFFWWNIKDYLVQEGDGVYILKNSYRKILVDKKTLLPVQQVIELANGDELNILYDAPAHSEEAAKDSQASLSQRYQSKLTIGLKNHLLRIKVKSYTAAGK